MIIIPVVYKDSAQALVDKAGELAEALRRAGVRCDVDARGNYTAGWKYNHWEQRGVPIRLELGPKDLAASQVRRGRAGGGGRGGIHRWLKGGQPVESKEARGRFVLVLVCGRGGGSFIRGEGGRSSILALCLLTTLLSPS